MSQKNYTDAEIFDALRQKLRPAKLTQAIVDVVNVALGDPEARLGIIETLELPKYQNPSKHVTRPYNLTPETLRRVYPGANTSVIPIILELAPIYGVVTKKQMCAFLANMLVESRGFNASRESFRYRPTRLLQVFRHRVKTLTFAKQLIAKGQPAVANFLYGSRLGNRRGTNDGWNYRGGGWIQLTGRANYEEVEDATGIPIGQNPDNIENPKYAAIAAFHFWKTRGLNELAETINIYKDGYTLNTLDGRGRETKNYRMNYGMSRVRKTINGYYNGYEEVCEYFEKCMKYM